MMPKIQEDRFTPDEMSDYVQKGLFRNASWKESRIGGTKEDPKFNYHTLEFRGPNWFGFVRIVIVGKAARLANPGCRWYNVQIYIRRTDGPMFMAQNDCHDTVVSLGKKIEDGEIEEPYPQELYPYLEAALDEHVSLVNVPLESGDEIRNTVSRIGLSIISYLQGAAYIRESISANEFMDNVFQAGSGPLEWESTQARYSRGVEVWVCPVYILRFGPFDRKIRGNIEIVLNIQHKNDQNEYKCQASFEVRAGDFDKAMPDVCFETSFYTGEEKIPGILKAYEHCLRTAMRPLLDRRGEHGYTLLRSGSEGLKSAFLSALRNYRAPEVAESVFGPEDVEDVAMAGIVAQYVGQWATTPDRYVLKFKYPYFVSYDPKDTSHEGSVFVDEADGQASVSVEYTSDSYEAYRAVWQHETKPLKIKSVQALLDTLREAVFYLVRRYYETGTDPGGEEAASRSAFTCVNKRLKNSGYVSEGMLSPEEMDEFGQVVADVGLVSPWRKANAAVRQVPIYIWASDISVPAANWRDMTYKGYITAYPGSEHPWILFSGLEATRDSKVGSGRYIVGYTKGEPSKDVLDKFRQATLDAIKANMIHEPQLSAQGLVDRITIRTQGLLKGHPELAGINSLALIHESTDAEQFAGEFFKYDGIGEWVTKDSIWSNVPVGTWSTLNFRLGNTVGCITFAEYEVSTGPWKDDYVQEIILSMYDNYTSEALDRRIISTPQTGMKFLVPKAEISQALASLRDACLYVKKIAQRDAPVIPNYNGQITRKFLAAMSRWFVRNESLGDELMAELISHGGPPLEWKRGQTRAGPSYVLKSGSFDRSHGIGLVIQRDPIIGSDVYLLGLHANCNVDTDESPLDAELDTDVWVLLPTPRKMAALQNSMIEFVKWYIATYTPDNPMAGRGVLSDVVDKFQQAVKVAELKEGMADELVGELIAHGGAPLEWVEHKSEPGVLWLDFTWFDGSYSGRVRMSPLTAAQPSTAVFKYWNASLLICRGPHGPLNVASMAKSALTLNTPNVRKKIIEFAIKIMSIFGHERPILHEHIDFIRHEFDMATNWGGLGETVVEELELTFRSECRGAHSGQSDMTLYAEREGFAVGRVEYSIYDDEIAVQFIHTNPRYRRQGIATQLLKQLQKEYPDFEIKLGMSVGHGTDLVNSLDRDYLENPAYRKLETTYRELKAENDALQAEFDKYFASGEKIPDNVRQAFLLKGERMNELQILLWDLEDQMRDQKPGKWRIKEGAEEFYLDYVDANMVTKWWGHPQTTSDPGGAYLSANKKGLKGPVSFNAYMRPYSRNDIRLDCSFQIGCWASSTVDFVNSETFDCPEIAIRLSPNEEYKRNQPGLIQDFQDAMYEAFQEISRQVSYDRPEQVGRDFYNRLVSWLKRRHWDFDIDKVGKPWDLASTSVEESVFTPEEGEEFIKQTNTVWAEWDSKTFHSDVGNYDAVNWTMTIHAPREEFVNSYIRLRYYPVEEEDGLQRVSIDFSIVVPIWVTSFKGSPFVQGYDHVSPAESVTIHPEEGADLRKALEAEFFRVLGKAAIESSPQDRSEPYGFKLHAIKHIALEGFKRVVAAFAVPGAVWVSPVK